MMEVWSNFAWLFTAFHTLDTHGQVVSTISTPRSLSSVISCTDAPNAGRITTSPALTREKSLPSGDSGMSWTSISVSLSLTVGLWMISLVMCRSRSGKVALASYAICTARSTPQQNPYDTASLTVKSPTVRWWPSSRSWAMSPRAEYPTPSRSIWPLLVSLLFGRLMYRWVFCSSRRNRAALNFSSGACHRFGVGPSASREAASRMYRCRDRITSTAPSPRSPVAAASFAASR